MLAFNRDTESLKRRIRNAGRLRQIAEEGMVASSLPVSPRGHTLRLDLGNLIVPASPENLFQLAVLVKDNSPDELPELLGLCASRDALQEAERKGTGTEWAERKPLHTNMTLERYLFLKGFGDRLREVLAG